MHEDQRSAQPTLVQRLRLAEFPDSFRHGCSLAPRVDVFPLGLVHAQEHQFLSPDLAGQQQDDER